VESSKKKPGGTESGSTITTRSAQWGRSGLGGKRIFIPTPHRFPSFFTGLHGIGHIMSNHHSWDGKPEYLWEYEAFYWAVNFCREGEIKVPQRTINYERSIIAEKIREAIERHLKKIDRRVLRFVREGEDDDPDIVFVKKNLADDGSLNKISR